MSDVANAPIDLANNSELIADLARFSEGVLTEQQIRRKWRHLDDNVWEAPDDALVDAVEAERVRRVRSGRAAREKAQNLAVQAPDILGNDNDQRWKFIASPNRGGERIACGR